MVASFVSLPVCYGGNVVNAVPGTGLPINPHLQAVLMRGFALVAVHALWRDRRSHGNSLPI